MSSLFDSLPKASKPQRDPRIHVCRACQRVGASCGIGEAWFCPGCVAPSFWPKNRERP